SWLVLELTGSPFQLGLVNTLQFTPILLLSAVGGALSDRLGKRRILLVTQAAMMAQAFVLALLVRSGHVRYWHVAVLATIYGVGRAIDIPARQSFLSDLVGKADLPNAVAQLAGLQRRAHPVTARGRAPHRGLRRGHRLLPERRELRGGAGCPRGHPHRGPSRSCGTARHPARADGCGPVCPEHAGGGLHPLAARGGEPPRPQLQRG